MSKARKVYQRPEVVELGAAEELTLGSLGCGIDFLGCERKVKPEVEAY